MKNKQTKWIERMFIMWLFTLLIAIIGGLAQLVFPMVFKKDKYMEMVMNLKDTVFVMVISIIVCILLYVATQSKSKYIQGYVNNISKKKSDRVLYTGISAIFCIGLSLIAITSVISGVVTAKNVKTMHGKVDNIISTTSSKNGEVYKILVVKDADGKKHRFYKNRNLDALDVNIKDDITLDYVKTNNHDMKMSEGNVMGYVSHTKNTKS